MFPFGKLGSWLCQCEMNNETFHTLLIFYLMCNSSLLHRKAPRELVCMAYRCRVKGKVSKRLFNICMKVGMKVKRLWSGYVGRSWISAGRFLDITQWLCKGMGTDVFWCCASLILIGIRKWPGVIWFTRRPQVWTCLNVRNWLYHTEQIKNNHILFS